MQLLKTCTNKQTCQGNLEQLPILYCKRNVNFQKKKKINKIVVSFSKVLILIASKIKQLSKNTNYKDSVKLQRKIKSLEIKNES